MSMAADRLTIDPATVFDNVEKDRVEFAGDAGDDRHAFAVLYDALRALSGVDPVTEPVAVFHQYRDRIAEAGTTALARDQAQDIVVISENDL
jgi:hypothetical protein